MNQKKVLIVGAGLAGLCCARTLQTSGVDVKIFEADESVGGRIQTDLHAGFQLDRGFQVLLTSYPEVQTTLDLEQLRLGSFEPGALIWLNGRLNSFNDPWRRPSSLLPTLFSSLASFTDKLRVAKLRLQVTRGPVSRIFDRPQKSTIKYLQDFGFSRSIIDRFFRPFFGGVFLESELATSSRKFEYLFRMFSTGVATLPQGGMQAVPQQIFDSLLPNTVELNSEVAKVEEGKIELSQGQVETGTHVVLATPAHVTDKILGRKSALAFNAVECHYYSAEKSPLKSKSLVLNGEGIGPVNTVCVPSDICADYAPNDLSLISVSVLGQHFDDDADRQQAKLKSQLSQWFGSGVEQWKLLKTTRISQALPKQTPSNFDPVIKSPLIGNSTYACGDYQGVSSIQGAMESGRRTAEAILRS